MALTNKGTDGMGGGSPDAEIMSGALFFTGTSVPVKNLFDYLEGSSSPEVFLNNFPSVSRGRTVAVSGNGFSAAPHPSAASDLPVRRTTTMRTSR